MRRRIGLLLGLVVALLAVAIVGLSGAAGGLYWNRVERRGAQAARAQLAPLAAEEIPKVLGYEYQTVERSLIAAYPLLTPAYRRTFEERATKDIIPQARAQQVVNQITVAGVGVLDARRVSGSVMVYLNRTVQDRSNEPRYFGSRVRVDYRKIGGDWLIDDIAPI